MKIVCLADAHLVQNEMVKYLKVCDKLFFSADKIVFLGDGIDKVRTFLSSYKDVIHIKGSHDKDLGFNPLFEELEVDGAKLLFIHGDRDQKIREQINIWGNKLRRLMGIKPNLKAYYLWLYKKYQGKFNIVVYGHIHIPRIEVVGKTAFFCPGGFPSKRLSFGHDPSVGVIDIYKVQGNQKIDLKIYNVDNQSLKKCMHKTHYMS